MNSDAYASPLSRPFSRSLPSSVSSGPWPTAARSRRQNA